MASDNFLLFQELSSLGSTAELNLSIDLENYEREIASFHQDWIPYNPRKPGYNRFGLSLTSLDGKASGIPDLDSLVEFNQLTGSHWQEKDFTHPTPVLGRLPSVAKALNPILENLGRTHILKMGRGGFFPPHRDAKGNTINCIRVLVVLKGTSNIDYSFVLDERSLKLTPGKAYFVNTVLTHSLVSFVEDFQVLVCNVILSRQVVDKIYQLLTVR